MTRAASRPTARRPSTGTGLHRACRTALRAVHPQYILASQRHPEAPRLSPTAREAIAAASALANDPDFNVYMDLQPGEMQFINNYHVLHGRTAYEDDVAHGYKRHLKRLWLATYALTDRPAAFAARGRRNRWRARRSVSTLPQ